MFHVSSSCYHGLVCVLCIFLTLSWVDLCSVYLPYVTMGWSVICVSSSRCHGLGVLCVSSSRDMGWSVFCVPYSRCHGLVCALCIFLTLPWVGLCSVYLTHVAMGWSVLCVSSSRYHGLVCVLCIFLTLHGLICVPCIFLTLPWVGLCSVFLPHVTMGWSVICVSSSRCMG